MNISKLFVCAIALAMTCVSEANGAELKGMVFDPSGQAVAGAQVAAVNSLGVITKQVTDDHGTFALYVSPLYENVQLRVTAQGFETVTVNAAAGVIKLALAAQNESIQVTASVINAIPSEQGSNVSVITGEELRESNQAQAVDLLRTLPGMVISQNGARGSVADLFVRGGDPKFNLVLLNGVPVNSFYYGGLFDFAHISADAIEQVQIARGPQSAVFGSYALGSAVSFETRSPANGPALDVVAEGGTHMENRFALSGQKMLARDWGLAASFSSLNANGPVANSDYRNYNGLLALDHRWHAKKLSLFGDFDSNDVGEPGAYGSNPKGYYAGLDLISRSKNNTSTYGAHFNDDLTDKLRIDLMAGVFWNNNLYISPYGTSFNKDLSANGEGRVTFAVNGYWTMAAGYVYLREQMRNTYVTTTNGDSFLLRRNDSSFYQENRLTFGKFFLNLGLRTETYRTPLIPGNAFGYPARPDFPARTDVKVNPKLSAAYFVRPQTRLHASYGTGIRPPGGSDLAFTDNPALLPERVASYDAGAEERMLGGKLSLDGTWFHNRYRDLIVSLGGSLSTLSKFSTGNLANAEAQGLEFTSQLRPANWISLDGSYTWLETRVLSLDGSTGQVQTYYYLGQPLFRRPKHSGSFTATVRHGRFAMNVTAGLRSHTLDVEPNYGAFGGTYTNLGYQSVGINLNYRVKGNLTMYANMSNAFNQHYEEIYGYPAPLFSLIMGLKWSLARAR
jgi:outer membrane cobalamin receptor